MSHEETAYDNPQPEDQAIGRVVRAAVAEDLERQRGRAAMAFREAMQNAAFHMHRETKREPGWGLTFKLHWLAGTSSAIAACLAVVLTAQFLMRPPIAPTGSTATNSQTPVIDRITYTQNFDGGTVVLQDQTPARMLRQQTVKQTEWFDPSENATYSVTQPVETVEYQQLQPY
ncbi:MAG: hypothetical protein FWD61_05820 [Phycisphaerales bacterium]|nr:hypothetical protein [Phycisphaerales bacterium]